LEPAETAATRPVVADMVAERISELGAIDDL